MQVAQENTYTKVTHQVLLHPVPFKQQPQKIAMGQITNELKEYYPQPMGVKAILNKFADGHSIMLANVELNEHKAFRFIASRLFAIDIDDDNQVTSPEEVIFKLKNKIVGLFYTFSHGIKGNRYRLLFQLDRTVTDELKMRGIIEQISKDLIDLGIPADIQAKNPMQIVRGGKSCVLVNENNTLNTTKLLERVQKENLKRQQELYDSFEKDLRPVSFSVLKEMAQKVGYIASGTGDGERWKRIVIGIRHYANLGHITDDEGFELFDIISGGEQSQRAWETLRANGQATIKTLIYEAKQKGYKGKYTYYTESDDVKKTYESEKIKVKRYIPKEVAKEIIGRKKRILVNSPTGSGKTTCFLDAFKDLESKRNHFYIFATPTIALTLQNATKHQLMCVKGQTKNLFKEVNQYIKSGRRIFMSTYDMAPILVEFLRLLDEKITFTLVVDEMHKFVTDYDLSYRYEAIKNLHEISLQATSFIGLSGTIDDIYKNEFETVIDIDNGNPQSPCQEFAVYTYEKKADSLPELAQLIEVWTSRRKLLIYIQSKKKIEMLKKLLQRKGIKVRAINANSKSNPTYKQLVDNETIDEGVQVVLTTSVIADGVNIQNDLEWEVIAVCNDYSNLFNYSSIKQISNRLRNTYRRFSIFMQEPKNKDKESFRLESAYQFWVKIATQIVDEINSHPYFEPKLFRSSVIERRYGIYQSVEGLNIDTLFLRHAVSKEQERYFYAYRLAFVGAVEKALHTKAEEILNISQEIRNKTLDLTYYREILQELDEEEQKEEEVKASSVKDAFTLKVYQAFQEDGEDKLNEFKREVLPIHYACLTKITKIADYETCHKIVNRVERPADTHRFYGAIKSLAEANYLTALNRPNKTKKVLVALLKLKEFMTNEEYDVHVIKIAKKTRTRKADVKSVEKMLTTERSRVNTTRLKRFVGIITLETITSKFDLPIETVKAVTLKYSQGRGKTFETVIKSRFTHIEEQKNGSQNTLF
ncbi:DEAD/DEAH box helicase family protein [Bacillus spongiae]|uniref:DEAD/DEAH box helicase family protein n=1 Tax=Bacillus spongiae TaxID=2683610 RepID=A0ABU8HJY6_9BACI